MRRSLEGPIREILQRKIVLLMGPRQVGKTTLAKSLTKDCAYYNYDIRRDLAVFREQKWDRSRSLVIFDDLHKKMGDSLAGRFFLFVCILSIYRSCKDKAALSKIMISF